MYLQVYLLSRGQANPHGRECGRGGIGLSDTLKARRIDFTGGSDDKKSACNAGDLGLIPELGRSPGEGNSYPLQYSGLENSMDRGAGRIQSIGLQRVRATFTQIQSGSLIHHEEGLDLIFMTL